MFVDLAVVIVNLPTPMMVKILRATLGHTGYYQKFIRKYTMITTPMEKLFKKDANFKWNDKFQRSLNTLKKKMVAATILVFLD